jgi:hypothetical protein
MRFIRFMFERPVCVRRRYEYIRACLASMPNALSPHTHTLTHSLRSLRNVSYSPLYSQDTHFMQSGKYKPSCIGRLSIFATISAYRSNCA